MTKLGILKTNDVAIVIIDIQEKLVPAMYDVEETITNANLLIIASEILKIPLIITEQYPRGLGKTHISVELPEESTVFEKTSFSCFGEPNFAQKITDLGVKSLILAGMEAHVCVLQTALDALNLDIDVFLVTDAITSRKSESKSVGIERMKQSGVFVVTTEMVIFQLLEKAGTDEFKQLSKLIK